MNVVNLAQVQLNAEGNFDQYRFTDGSARKISRKMTSAGWGFAAMKTYRNDGGGSPIVSACGPVQTDESGEYWVGATRPTNNTAEMQAMIEALYWLNSCIEGKFYSLSTKSIDYRGFALRSSKRSSRQGRTRLLRCFSAICGK